MNYSSFLQPKDLIIEKNIFPLAGVDPDWTTHAKETPLILAARQGQHDALISLINARADVDFATNEGYTPLWEGEHFLFLFN